MKALIIYKSKTGFTKWYAEVIAKETGGDLIDFMDVSAEKMSEYDVVVYGGGLYAGKINGYKKAKEMKTIPHFYMQGGICYEKMSLANKAIMKMMSGVLGKKTDKDHVEEGFALAIQSSYDITSKEYAKPLIKCLLEG